MGDWAEIGKHSYVTIDAIYYQINIPEITSFRFKLVQQKKSGLSRIHSIYNEYYIDSFGEKKQTRKANDKKRVDSTHSKNPSVSLMNYEVVVVDFLFVHVLLVFDV